MTDAERIAATIQKALPVMKRGTLRFWGRWFGRPHDNIHTVTGASANGDTLEVRFDKGETLHIVRPTKATIDARHFVIGDAAKVRWEWNAYGSPPGRRHFEEYVRNEDEIAASSDVDWFTPAFRPSVTAAAVEIV